MAHVEVEATEVVGEVAVQPPRRSSVLASLERLLGLAVEIPAAILVVAEIVILFAGVVARYVDFPMINFISGISVTDAEVRAYYDENPARFPKPAEVKPAADAKVPVPAPKSDPAADFAAVTDKNARIFAAVSTHSRTNAKARRKPQLSTRLSRCQCYFRR